MSDIKASVHDDIECNNRIFPFMLEIVSTRSDK